MKLLLVVAYFVPEIGSAAHIYFDLARALAKRGHEVHVITSYPRKFNLSKIDANKEFPIEETIDNVFIHRHNHLALRDNISMRGAEHFLLPYYYFRTYKRLNIVFDACLIYIPPLPLYYFSKFIKKFYNIPSVLNYQDFHPQELTDVGVLRNRLLIRIMKYIEHQSYRNADFITVLSEGGINYVAARGGDISKIRHIFNGCILSDSNETVKPEFKIYERIEDKFLITYAGILSPFQGLDIILDAAKGLASHKDIIFYIVGDGLIKNRLMQRLMDENISNVRLLPLQPRNIYQDIIESSDISIISLDGRMAAPCIPGKLINLIGMKSPIIAIVPENSETAQVVKKAKCGVVVSPGNYEELINAILAMRADSAVRKSFGENGMKFLASNMDLSANAEKYEQIFMMLKPD